MARREIPINAPRDFDVAIIGCGPAGVATAIGVKSEGPSVVVLDEKSPGGQIVTSSKIENVFGVPVGGLTGIELMGRGIDQAKAFGTQFRSPFRAVRLTKDPKTGIFTIVAANRERLTAATIVLALGASLRRLNADGVEQFTGRGVVYGAPQYQVPGQWEGKKVGIIGGGNSAGQAALFLAGCEGCQVDVLVRGEGLESDMSTYLLKKVKELTNINVHPFSSLRSVNSNSGRDWMSGVTIQQQGKDVDVPLHYLLVQIGAEPPTGWLEDVLEIDPKGYILTDRDIPTDKWPASVGRPPFRYETSMPGVFAGGDCHSGSPNRMSCAVGEGHALAVSVYKYLTLPQQETEQKLHVVA